MPGKQVVIAKNVRDSQGNIVNDKKNWVVTSFDNNIPQQKKGTATRVTPGQSIAEAGAVTPDLSDSKDTETLADEQISGKESTLQSTADKAKEDLVEGLADVFRQFKEVRANNPEPGIDGNLEAEKEIGNMLRSADDETLLNIGDIWREACKRAGLDGGLGWAMRVSMPHAVPEERRKRLQQMRGERAAIGEPAAGETESSDRGAGTAADSEGADDAERLRDSDGRASSGHLAERQGDIQPSEGVKLSEETDDNGLFLVLSSNGTINFGSIRKGEGIHALPIRLSEGFNKVLANGENKGYGLEHIEAGHGADIRNAGFKSVPEFVEFVARGYEKILVGNARKNGTQTFLIELRDKKSNVLYIELSKDENYWTVNSAGIFREGYTKNKKTVEPLPAIEASPAAADGIVQEQGGSPLSGNSSSTDSSDGKGNTLSSDKQESSAESSENSTQTSVQASVQAAEAEVNTEPTQVQAEAGNYKMNQQETAGQAKRLRRTAAVSIWGMIQKRKKTKKPVEESAGLNHSPGRSRSYILIIERLCKITNNNRESKKFSRKIRRKKELSRSNY